MKKDIKGSIIRGYMRRGLLQIAFSETADEIERRLLLDEMRALFVVPWKIVEDNDQWQPSKDAFKEAATALYHIRADRAAAIRNKRNGVSILDLTKTAQQ